MQLRAPCRRARTGKRSGHSACARPSHASCPLGLGSCQSPARAAAPPPGTQISPPPGRRSQSPPLSGCCACTVTCHAHWPSAAQPHVACLHLPHHEMQQLLNTWLGLIKTIRLLSLTRCTVTASSAILLPLHTCQDGVRRCCSESPHVEVELVRVAVRLHHLPDLLSCFLRLLNAPVGLRGTDRLLSQCDTLGIMSICESSIQRPISPSAWLNWTGTVSRPLPHGMVQTFCRVFMESACKIVEI